MSTKDSSSNSQPINLGGTDKNVTQKLVMKNTDVNCSKSSYALSAWVPAEIEVTGGTLNGYASLQIGDLGGATVTFDGVKLNNPNKNAGLSNAFAAIAILKGAGNTINLKDCTVVNTAVDEEKAPQYFVEVRTDGNEINIIGTLKATNAAIAVDEDVKNTKVNVDGTVKTDDGQGVHFDGSNNSASNEIKFPAPKPEIPKTGDESNLVLWSAMLLMGAAVLMMTRRQMGQAK